MPVARFLVILWKTAKFLAATSTAFAIAALFSFALAKRLRDEEFPGWEAFAYGFCCFALAFELWWRELLRWWLKAAPADHAVFLAFGACASFYFAVFLAEFVALLEPPITTTRLKSLRVLVALTALAGTALISDVATIHSPVSRALRARLKPARASGPREAGAPSPKAG